MEESLESLGIWVALLGALGIFSNLSPLPKRRHGLALYGLPVVLVFLLLSSGAVPPVSDQKGDEGSALLETGAQLHGFEIKRSGHAIEVHLFLSPSGLDFNGLGYSVSLVDQVSLDVLAMRNSFASKQLNFLIAPGYIPVWRQWTELILPDDAPSNHAFWIALKFWQEKAGGFPTVGFEQSDLPLWNDSLIILDASVLKARAVPDASPASLAIFDNRFVLNALELPPRAQAGEVLRATMSWRVETAGTYDWIQFLHFLHEESGEWFVYDQQPLGARLPTRLWYSGLADSETWEVPLPAGLAPGRYEVFTGLYRVTDLERMIARDPSGEPFLDARVPLGSLIVTNEG